MKNLILLIICVFLGETHRGEAAGGIVHDPQNFLRQAEILTQATEQVNQINKQIENLTAQLKQGKEHYESITGNRGFGEKHHNAKLQQSLPQEWQGLYQATQRTMSALKGFEDTVANEEKLTGSIDDMQEQIGKRMERVAVTDKAVCLQAYQGVQERMKQVDNLMIEINKTNDAKSIAELQARISIEQAYIQNEMTKLQLVGQLQRAEQQLIEHQKYQMSRRILNPKLTEMPKIR